MYTEDLRDSENFQRPHIEIYYLTVHNSVGFENHKSRFPHLIYLICMLCLMILADQTIPSFTLPKSN